MKHPFALFSTLAILSGSTQAALVVSESFDYSVGDIAVDSLNGGTGFDGAWTWSDAGSATPTIVSPGLTHSGTDAAGNAISRDGTNSASTIARNISAASQSALQANSSLWFSTLVDFKNSANARVGFTFGTTALDNDTYPTMTSGDGLGFRFGTSSGSNTNYENIYAFGFDTGAETRSTNFFDTGEIAANYLIVGEIAANALNLYVFKDGDAINISGGADASIAHSLDSSTFTTVSWNDNQRYGLDEIRLGTDFASVTAAVPEPSASALLGLGGLVLLLRRRK